MSSGSMLASAATTMTAVAFGAMVAVGVALGANGVTMFGPG